MILIPRHRDIIVPLKTQSARVRGFYKFEAVRQDGSRRLLADWFPNILTNSGADYLGISQFSGPLTYCAVGSGNSTPVVTDTTLDTFVAATTTTNSTTHTAASSSPYFGTTTIQYNFPIGTATGNLSEVGVGPENSSSARLNLFSRALILDGMGNPTTITVLSSEALYVTFQINQYVPLSDVTGNVTISGTSYAYTLRAYFATSTTWAYQNDDAPTLNLAAAYNGAIGSITSSGPSGTASSGTVSSNSYSNGSSTLTGTITWGLAAGNLAGGISAISFTAGTSRGSYQIGFSPAIPKTSSQVLTLDVGTSWAINST